jgi:hypothetical protein
VKTSRWSQVWPSIALWSAGAACLAVQVLLPGFIGIANNGDFGKVNGWLCLAPRGGEPPFIHFQPDYVWSARNYWNSPYHSSESAVAWLATRLAGATHEGAAFDIRWLGALHAALCLAAFAVLLASLRGTGGRAPVASAVLPLVAFTDVCYTAYLNSFFMDAAALCGLLVMTAAAVWMVARWDHVCTSVGQSILAGVPSGDGFPAGVRTRWKARPQARLPAPRGLPLSVFVLAALLFVTSKTQHAVWMGLPAALLIACGFHWNRRWRAMAWSAAGLVLLAGAGMLITTDSAYRGEALFNVVFFRLGPAGADLRSLGVRPEELRYSGTHAYMPGTPVVDYEWTAEFGRRTGFARLMGWYARHPGSTLGFLSKTLEVGAPEMRQSNLSNFRAEAGRPPGARTERFAMWSNFRAWLLRRWPWHIPLWYVVFIAGCLAIRSPLGWVGMGIAALGLGEFALAALGDSLDPGRHLFLFHAATDLTFCFAAAWLLQNWLPKAIRHTP